MIFSKNSSGSGNRALTTVFAALAAAGAILAVWALLSGGRSGEPVASSSDMPFIITEIMPDNASALRDGSDNYYDWVEIYNASGSEASLQGCYLSDSESVPLKWEFPPITMGAREYLIVFCSGEDRYDAQSGRPHTNFRLSSEGETLTLSKPSVMFSTTVEYGQSLPDVSYGLTMDDGGEKLSYKWLENATPGAVNTGGGADSVYMLPSAAVSGVVINEYQTKNTCTIYDSDGDYCDWVELYNLSEESVDLSGCALTDDETDTRKWRFPEGTVLEGNGYLLVYLSGKDKSGDELHASFRLGAEDTELVLYDRSSRLIDRAELAGLPEDISAGRSESGGMLYYTVPTPGRENGTRGFEQLSDTMSLAGQLYISEVCAAQRRKDVTSQPDWIELCNDTSETIDLAGYGLGRAPDRLREFVFGQVRIAPGGYAVVQAVGPEGGADSKQAPFKVSTAGTTLYLTDADGAVIDVFRTGKQRLGVTSGRASSASRARVFFSEPTPGKANSQACAASYAPKPEILSAGGYVAEGTKVRISVPEGTQVRYTTDGSVPTERSALYEDELEITGSVTVKAAAFAEGMLPSDYALATFLTDQPSTLPVVCLSADPTDLFDPTTGIYDFDNSDLYKDSSQRNELDVERRSDIEYYENGELVCRFTAGVRLSGAGSRNYNHRSLALMLRDIYGQSSVTYPFFKDCDRITAKGLVLRAGGQDKFNTFLRDGFCARVAGKYSDNILSSCCQPAAVYINGRYWGLYELREKINADYLSLNYGIRKDRLDIIRHNAIVVEGTYDRYLETTEFLGSHDLNDPAVFAQVSEMIDIDSAIDYIIFEHFFKNVDYGNIKTYLDKDGGKWRWIFFDMDLSMSESSEHENSTSVKNIYNQDLIIQKLKDSQLFRDRLLTRYGELMDTAFAPEELLSILNDLSDEIEPEIERHSKRWGNLSYASWTSQMDELRAHLKVRRDVVKRELIRYFRLDEQQQEKYFGSVQ